MKTRRYFEEINLRLEYYMDDWKRNVICKRNKEKGTRHRDQEEISGRGNAERAAMFKEKTWNNRGYFFWGFHF